MKKIFAPIITWYMATLKSGGYPLIALLMAFVLAQTYASFTVAGNAAAEEASAVLSEASHAANQDGLNS